MSSDATYIPIGLTPNKRAREAVNSEPAALAAPSLRSNAGLEEAEPTTGSSKKQLTGKVSDGSGESSDEFLLAQTANGSKEALGLLFRRYRRTVWSVARRILRDETEAEDLCQEVFLRLYQKANLFDAKKGAASSWIIQIAYRRAMSRRRYLAHRQHYNAQEFDEEQVGVGHKPLFIDELTARNLLNRLREQLSEEQRETLELHFLEGYSLGEIAEKTKQSLGNVRHHYYRALDRLRSNLFPKRDA